MCMARLIIFCSWFLGAHLFLSLFSFQMYLSCGQIKRCVGILEDYLKSHPSEADLSVIILLADVFMEIDAHSNALQHIEHAHMIYYSGKELPLELMIKAGICQVFLGNIEKAEVCLLL